MLVIRYKYNNEDSDSFCFSVYTILGHSDSVNTLLWHVFMPCWWGFFTEVSDVLRCLFHLYWFYYPYFSPTAFQICFSFFFVLSHQLLCDARTEKSLKNKRINATCYHSADMLHFQGGAVFSFLFLFYTPPNCLTLNLLNEHYFLMSDN